MGKIIFIPKYLDSTPCWIRHSLRHVMESSGPQDNKIKAPEKERISKIICVSVGSQSEHEIHGKRQLCKRRMNTKHRPRAGVKYWNSWATSTMCVWVSSGFSPEEELADWRTVWSPHREGSGHTQAPQLALPPPRRTQEVRSHRIGL